jgi:hypothetical protein
MKALIIIVGNFGDSQLPVPCCRLMITSRRPADIPVSTRETINQLGILLDEI